MSALLSSGPAGSERMPNRIDEVLLDPGNESVPNPGKAAKLFAALPEEISSPEQIWLEGWHGRSDVRPADGARFDVARHLRMRCLGVAIAKEKLLSQDAQFCTPTLLINEGLVPNMA